MRLETTSGGASHGGNSTQGFPLRVVDAPSHDGNSWVLWNASSLFIFFFFGPSSPQQHLFISTSIPEHNVTVPGDVITESWESVWRGGGIAKRMTVLESSKGHEYIMRVGFGIGIVCSPGMHLGYNTEYSRVAVYLKSV